MGKQSTASTDNWHDLVGEGVYTEMMTYKGARRLHFLAPQHHPL